MVRSTLDGCMNIIGDYVLPVILFFALCLLVLVIVLAFVDVISTNDTLMPGEYILGEDANGPVSIFYIGDIRNKQIYRLDDSDTQTTCYITMSGDVGISCVKSSMIVGKPLG